MAVLGCGSHKCRNKGGKRGATDPVAVFKFKKDPAVSNEWVRFSRRKNVWVPVADSVICMKQIYSSCLKPSDKYKNVL